MALSLRSTNSTNCTPPAAGSDAGRSTNCTNSEGPPPTDTSPPPPAANAALLALWQAAVEEVARLWEGVAAESRGRGEEPPWLDEDLDLRLHAELAECIRAGNAGGAETAIGRWKQAWLELLRQDAPPGKGTNWVEIQSDILGENIAVALRPVGIPQARAACPDIIIYDAVEVGRLDDVVDPKLLQAVHATKKVLDARVQDHRH